MRRLLKTSLRVRLIASMMLVVIFTGVISIIIGYYIINRSILNQAYEVLQRDINTAKYIYNNKVKSITSLLKHVASLSYVSEALENNKREVLLKKLTEVKEELGLDILNITDAQGRIVVRTRNPELYGDKVVQSKCVEKVIKWKDPCYGTDVIERDLLNKEGKDLVDQARIEVLPTYRARAVHKTLEERAMVLQAALPVFYKGRFIGVLYGAKILNKNYEIVDQIKSLVFKDERIGNYELGTVTIFLDDLRVSTNVKREDGTRTIGTRVSEEVYNKTFLQEKLWLDKAFVVNKWYLSAYEPIYDVDNIVVGILYVGILEDKYTSIERRTISYFLAMSLISATLAVMLSIYLIRYIIRPVRSILTASHEVVMGNFNKIADVPYNGEMGSLVRAYNTMIDAINERDRKIKEHTQKQILQSEKLASLGRLASGIAHEINNPLTGILTYSTLLKEDLYNTEYAEDLDVIVSETLRCRNIVRGILDFARETKLDKEPVVLNNIITETLAILENHVNFQNIKFVKELSSNVPVTNLDVNQMKSVINNLCMNAADAMPDGGTIYINTYYNKEKGVIVMQVTDTGIGIDEQNITKIFDPFFTTKETGKGTGLGLAVIYGIIERHDGFIDVKSKVGEGTTFTIELPVN